MPLLHTVQQWDIVQEPIMDNPLQQLDFDHIFSAPYHTQSYGKLEVFNKYPKPTLTKLCENDPDNWDKYINQVLASYHETPHLATAETPFFLVYGWEQNLPLYQLLEPIQYFLGDPESGRLDLELHHLALAIAKKTLDENRFKDTKKTTDHPILKLVTGKLEKQTTWQIGSKMESWLQNCLYRVQWILHPYRKPSYQKN